MNGNQNPGSNKPPSPVVRGSTPKKFKLVMGLFLLLVIVLGGLVVVRGYTKWRGTENVEKIARTLRQYEEELLERKLADTYGGKTPQETLRLYIEAVEKGDYELASKYFIEDYRGLELKNLQSSSRAKLNTLISLLKDSSQITGGYYPRDYMPEGKEFIIDNPIYIRMMLYPSGIWKIVEI